MPNILCLETSTDICSVCVSSGNEILAIKETALSHSHTKVITEFIDFCLKSAQLPYDKLDAVAIASGPGSYTSLRIGSATAKGICFGLDIPLITIDSLKIIAAGLARHGSKSDLLVPTIDARRNEIYYAIYNNDLQEISSVNNLILTSESFSDYKEQKLHFGGDGANKCRQIIESPVEFHEEIKSSSKWMPGLAFEAFKNRDFGDLAYFSPNYFKNPNITKSKKKLF